MRTGQEENQVGLFHAPLDLLAGRHVVDVVDDVGHAGVIERAGGVAVEVLLEALVLVVVDDQDGQALERGHR